MLWGLVATIFLTGTMRLAQSTGFTRMDIPLMLGTMVTPDRDRAKVWGFLIHVLNGWVLGSLYTAAFHSWRRSGLLLGALIGFFHGLFVLVSVLPLLPGVHPRMVSDFRGPEPTRLLEPPGFLAMNYGYGTPISTLVGQVIYGLTLGGFVQLERAMSG